MNNGNGLQIFPRKDGSNRSCKIRVGCGEAALLTGFNMPEGSTVCINRIEEDLCGCSSLEKEHYELNRHVGITSENCNGGVIGMPGCYVAILCVPADFEGDGLEWGVFANVCEAHDNLQTMAAMAALGN